jgi:hypothetical protein
LAEVAPTFAVDLAELALTFAVDLVEVAALDVLVAVFTGVLLAVCTEALPAVRAAGLLDVTVVARPGDLLEAIANILGATFFGGFAART